MFFPAKSIRPSLTNDRFLPLLSTEPKSFNLKTLLVPYCFSPSYQRELTFPN